MALSMPVDSHCAILGKEHTVTRLALYVLLQAVYFAKIHEAMNYLFHRDMRCSAMKY